MFRLPSLIECFYSPRLNALPANLLDESSSFLEQGESSMKIVECLMVDLGRDSLFLDCYLFVYFIHLGEKFL